MLDFQSRVLAWAESCFGAAKIASLELRRKRFLEEAAELAQAAGGSREEAHAVVNYVFGRERGDPAQEVGGVMTTLSTLCSALDLDLVGCALDGIASAEARTESIREKELSKPGAVSCTS